MAAGPALPCLKTFSHPRDAALLAHVAVFKPSPSGCSPLRPLPTRPNVLPPAQAPLALSYMPRCHVMSELRELGAETP